MARKLISLRNVDENIVDDKFYVSKDMILTSGVKDYLKEKHIDLVYGEIEKKEESEQKNLRPMIEKILKEDFNIVDNNMVEIILKKCEEVK